MSADEVPTVEKLAAGGELPAFFDHLGMSVVRATAEEAVVRMQVPKELLSPFGPVHGGAIAALIDTAIGIAVACRMAPGDRNATHELNINYIAFSKEPVVIATARVIRLGRSVAHCEAEARSAGGELIAKALATFGVFKK